MMDFSAHPGGPYAPPPLAFTDAALEPAMSAATVRLQRTAHLGYVARLNAALAHRPEWLSLSIEALMKRMEEAPDDIREIVRGEGGGHANHQFFWKIVSPTGGGAPSGALAEAIDRDFGGFAAFQRVFEERALALVGSGWAFLVVRPQEGMRLEALTLRDNGSVLSLPQPALGLLNCDLWEHAYALDHGVDRAAWLQAWWSVVDWRVVEARHAAFLAGRSPA